ncbi:MAG: GTP pyrophosphokinase [Candidatus Schekmanbacteria bacterium]|nr:GTP pyrophosphokinase [Candidatus Schekmanbacteria bacterium]
MNAEVADLLERAIALCVTAHQGQRDKAGAPYALHPLRISLAVASPEASVTALLHDVVEDTEWTLDGLRREGFPEALVAAVDCLTRRDGESYEDFVERVAANPLAREVKLADLADNLDVRRIEAVTDRDLQRLERYHRAWKRLSGETG